MIILWIGTWIINMRNTDPYCQYSANKSLEQMKSIVDGKFGNINNLKPSCEKSLAAALMDAFKRSLSINETFPNMKVRFN